MIFKNFAPFNYALRGVRNDRNVGEQRQRPVVDIEEGEWRKKTGFLSSLLTVHVS